MVVAEDGLRATPVTCPDLQAQLPVVVGDGQEKRIRGTGSPLQAKRTNQLTLLAQLSKFLSHGASDGRAISGEERKLPREATAPLSSMSPLLEAAILSYRETLRDYEARLILGLKADPELLDVRKLSIAEEILKERGIVSYMTDSRLRMERAALLRIGEGVTPPRPPIPAWLRWKVFRRDHYRCVKCGRHWDLTADHIIAFSNGGQTTIENLQTLCRWCNSQKGAS